MIPLFIGLALVNLLCLAAAAALGYTRSSEIGAALHMLAGVIATFLCCAVHCIVFTYFIATAKWIQHAVTVKHLNTALVDPTRSFKAQAFPAALLAMGVVFATAALGAATDSYGMRSYWHHALAIAALAINLIVAWIEFRAISRNGQLVDQVLAEIASVPS